MSFADDLIICQPPMEEPECSHPVKDHIFTVKVNIGFLKRNVGRIVYADTDNESGRKTEEYIIIGSIVLVILVCLAITMAILCITWRKRARVQIEKVGTEYKMENLEAKFRNQCSKELAAQENVSDLTSNLEVYDALFREYNVYTSKTLFSSKQSDFLTNQLTVFTEQTQQAMDTFKVLLSNRQFLLMFINTFEREESFTEHDKSTAATLLLILNQDNITGIMTTLIDDLIDHNMALQSPKLLLTRSECIAEKLLTQLLSISLYHYLKERSCPALYKLFKAIKVQTEKGPIDHFKNCGKYTLSEEKLLTSADTEINPVTLTLDVSHFDFAENKEKLILVQVLDCDTITQAKGKILDILYKNVPYSNRPSVHSTNLEVKEDDGGSYHLLNDEDASSTIDGVWKRINTLQHYKIQDRAKVNLFLKIELNESCSAMPVGGDSFKKSNPIVRTISGSNFWHLTKRHQTDDEKQLDSDFFLPRLLNTKDTLQTYIDDLFQAVLSVGSEPPIIIKFLTDYLDNAASRYRIKDLDVLHTWKCNSLLLRFWVNIIKNPELVLDVHKTPNVDSCLSVVARTLTDSCSTADLNLGPSSPSNQLLFAKDIPRYKGMVRQYLDDIASFPAVSDRDLKSFLTKRVFQEFYGSVNHASAILELYKYASKYRKEIYSQIYGTETAFSGMFSSFSAKLDSIFESVDSNTEK